MKIKLITIAVLICFISAFNLIFAQKKQMKFGRINAENLEGKYCPIDSNAHAYFIFDQGYARFEYADTRLSSSDFEGNQKGFQLHFTRHFRIKIIDQQGLNWGDIEIPLYHEMENEEDATKIKACTFNLEDDKIEEFKLSRKDIHKEQSSENWNLVKFALPNIKEGSIIEVEYTIRSDFLFNLPTWYFQHTIPALFSEIIVEVPEYYSYNQAQSGYFPIHLEESRTPNQIKLTYHQRAEGGSVQEGDYSQTLNYTDYISHYQAKDIPAIPDEKYVKNIKTYLSKVEFELRHKKFPYQEATYYSLSWDDVDQKLMKNKFFGEELKRTAHLQTESQLLQGLNIEGEQLISAAFKYIKGHFRWNGEKNKYLTNTLRSAYKAGGGNSADINLNMVALLREIGFESYPVILSTQKNGIIHPSHASLSRFNYVIAMVKVNDKTILLDATDPLAEPNILPVRCLNDRGRIIGESLQEWINLMDTKYFISSSNYEMNLSNELRLTGKFNRDMRDYGAYMKRKEIVDFGDLEEYKESLIEENDGKEIREIKISGLDTLGQMVNISYLFNQSDYLHEGGDMLYFSPVYNPILEENPFKLEMREYPVEFNYPSRIMQMYTYTIPDNYTVSEIPKSAAYKTPGNSIKFTYQVSEIGNKITVTQSMIVKKSLFLPQEYLPLKQIFQLIIDKQNELIVLSEK